MRRLLRAAVRHDDEIRVAVDDIRTRHTSHVGRIGDHAVRRSNDVPFVLHAIAVCAFPLTYGDAITLLVLLETLRQRVRCRDRIMKARRQETDRELAASVRLRPECVRRLGTHAQLDLQHFRKRAP